MEKIETVYEDQFYCDGRGPELKTVVWRKKGISLHGFEYFNPDDVFDDKNIKNLVLEQVEAFAMAGEEVHGKIRATGDSKGGIYQIKNSEWKNSFSQLHLNDCEHYQIMFYDQIYDVICRKILPGKGKIKNSTEQVAGDNAASHSAC